MYKVSIIIPIYNVGLYIKESLLSALNQTFESIQYILIDDCGTDNSMDLVNEILNNHPRKKNVFIIKHEKNKGLSGARNTGIKEATGEYIFFMDSDDEITSTCIETHYNALNSNDADFTVANIELVGSKSIHITSIDYSVKVKEDILKSFFKREWTVSACNKLYKRNFLKENEINFIEGLLHEDIIWSYRLSSSAQKIVCIPDKTYIYKIRDNSITTSQNSFRKIDSLISIIEVISKEWDNGYINKNLKNEIVQFITFWRFNTSLLLLNCSENDVMKRNYYKQLNCKKYRWTNNHSLLSILLRLPYRMYKNVLNIPYKLYKIKLI